MKRLFRNESRLIASIQFNMVSCTLANNMAGAGDDKIELFKFTLKICQAIGVFPAAYNQNHSPINRKNCYFLFCLVQFFISTAAYSLFEAVSTIEHVMVFYTCLTTALCLILYLIFMWQMKNILDYIGICERFIEKSKTA